MRFRYLTLIPAFLLLLVKFNAHAQQEAIDLYASSDLGIQGEIVNIEIRINNFVDILSFQASLNWDPSLLSYVSVTDFGIKDFSESNFGTSTVNQGHLRFLWEPNDALPITIVDSTLLFTASFEVISDQSQDVPIGYVDVTSSPAFPVEFANKDFQIVAVQSYEGQVTIISDYKDLVNINSNPNTSCDEKVKNGSLSADVMGNNSDYVFHWYIGTEIRVTPDFVGSLYAGLGAGDYTLQVQHLDGSIFVEKIDTAVLDAPAGIPDQITLVSLKSQSSCSDDPLKLTGEIEIAVNDAQPADTYTISWWKGAVGAGEELTMHQDAFIAGMLDADDYEIRVENKGTGCASYHQESITEDLVQFSAELSTTSNNYCADGANGSVSAEVLDQTGLDLIYYWFNDGNEIDTLQALGKGQQLANLPAANYRSWIIDLVSECTATATISVENELIFSEAIIEQRNDTLYANDENANWYRNDIDLEIAAAYIAPDIAGNYHFTIINNYNCLSESDALFFGITSLDELQDKLEIHPNPFKEFVRVSNPSANISSISVMDMRGVLLKEIYDIKDKFIDIYLSGSSNGIYLLKIHQEGKSITRKVVKNQF